MIQSSVLPCSISTAKYQYELQSIGPTHSRYCVFLSVPALNDFCLTGQLDVFFATHSFLFFSTLDHTGWFYFLFCHWLTCCTGWLLFCFPVAVGNARWIVCFSHLCLGQGLFLFFSFDSGMSLLQKHYSWFCSMACMSWWPHSLIAFFVSMHAIQVVCSSVLLHVAVMLPMLLVDYLKKLPHRLIAVLFSSLLLTYMLHSLIAFPLFSSNQCQVHCGFLWVLIERGFFNGHLMESAHATVAGLLTVPHLICFPPVCCGIIFLFLACTNWQLHLLIVGLFLHHTGMEFLFCSTWHLAAMLHTLIVLFVF